MRGAACGIGRKDSKLVCCPVTGDEQGITMRSGGKPLTGRLESRESRRQIGKQQASRVEAIPLVDAHDSVGNPLEP